MRGLEPPRPYGHTDLNRARLPIPPHPRGASDSSGALLHAMRGPKPGRDGRKANRPPAEPSAEGGARGGTTGSPTQQFRHIRAAPTIVATRAPTSYGHACSPKPLRRRLTPQCPASPSSSPSSPRASPRSAAQQLRTSPAATVSRSSCDCRRRRWRTRVVTGPPPSSASRSSTRRCSELCGTPSPTPFPAGATASSPTASPSSRRSRSCPGCGRCPVSATCYRGRRTPWPWIAAPAGSAHRRSGAPSFRRPVRA